VKEVKRRLAKTLILKKKDQLPLRFYGEREI
jgi:hypothetical protein